MNPFLLSPSERLSEWRDFRASIQNMGDLDQLLKVARWGGQAPLCNYSMDWDNPKSWLTPWELIHEGTFCPTAVAYLMEQTLLMAGWDSSRLRLIYIKNQEEGVEKLLLLVDDAWVLNYSIGEVFNFDNIRSGSALLATYQAVADGHQSV